MIFLYKLTYNNNVYVTDIFSQNSIKECETDSQDNNLLCKKKIKITVTENKTNKWKVKKSNKKMKQFSLKKKWNLKHFFPL